MANETIKKEEKDPIVYITIVDSGKPEDCLDRSTVFSANGEVYVFDETNPRPIQKSVLKMITRARNIVYRGEQQSDGFIKTKKISSVRYTIEEHDAPQAVEA